MAAGTKATERTYVEYRDGAYWIAGTRISLDSIVLIFLEGQSPESIVTESFPTLTLEQIYGAITFYLAHRSEVDAYLSRAESDADVLREATHKANSDLSDKLKKARREMLRKGS
jgi:uncharacterized protein (DUF433 family)